MSAERARGAMIGLISAMSIGLLASAGPARPETPEEEAQRRGRKVGAERSKREAREAAALPAQGPRSAHPLDAERLKTSAQKNALKARRRAAAWNGAR